MDMIKNGRLYAGEPVKIDDVTVVNPTEEMLLKAGWKEYIKPEEPESEPPHGMSEMDGAEEAL